MSIVPVARSNNRLVASAHYGRILREYNERLARDGIVNEKKFWEEVVAGLVPSYTLNAWYNFVRRFRSDVGLVMANAIAHKTPPVAPMDGESQVATQMLSNQQATTKLIMSLLNVSAAAAEEIMSKPELLSAKDRAELGFKAMKAQDSRIHAVGKLREDAREQDRFDRTFEDANFA